MSERRFTYGETIDYNFFDVFEGKKYLGMVQRDSTKIVDRLNEQQLVISKLDEHNTGYMVENLTLKKENNQLKDENERLRLELETHKHPLWSTREAERKLSEVTNNLANEIKQNGLLNEEINQLRIENMRLKKKCGDSV